MLTRLLVLAAAVLLQASSVAAQPAAASPTQFTFYYDYTVLPGKEAEFLDLVKTAGGPVRDKLMADGVISEWGVEKPLLRTPGTPTLSVWYVAKDLTSVGKVQAAVGEMLAKPFAGAAPSKTGKAKTNAERGLELLDPSKTRDWLIRDLENGYGSALPPAGAQPFIRYTSYKVRPGKGQEFRRVWDKYNKPVLEALVKDGVVEAWGLAVEELKTTGDFTHLVWVVTGDLAGMDTLRAALAADRDKRSQDERDAITAAFVATIDADAIRNQIAQLVVLKMAAQK